MKKRGLYVHIPFCASKCAYCDFYSIASSELYMRYINVLCQSASLMSKKFSSDSFKSVYIGGGTPSIISAELLERLLSSLKNSFNIEKDAEITLEANPATLDAYKLSVACKNGINRLSLGCQSTHDRELKSLSRIHTFSDFCDSFKLARACGIKNISVDLMYGIPLQTTESLLVSIDEIADLSPEHISLYGLKIEPDTPFGRDPHLLLPDDDIQCEMYNLAVTRLAKYGYQRYEISNFAKNDHYSRHNMLYWECEEYLGLGPAAHSYIDNVRYAYPRDIMLYISSLENGIFPDFSEETHLSQSDRISEYIMLSLRLERGLSTKKLSEKFGEHEVERLISKCRPYIGKFMRFADSTLSFTTEGFLVSNTILSQII